MMKNLAIGILAGAVAVMALALCRPRMMNVPPFDAAPVTIEGLPPLPPEPQAWEMGVRPATTAAANPLDQVIEEVKFNTVSAQDVVAYLEDLTGARIVMEWGVLNQRGVYTDTPVNLNVRHLPLRRVLDLMLANTTDGGKLIYRWQDGVVTVSTHEDLDKVWRTYDIRDLMAEALRCSRRFSSIAPPIAAPSSGPGTQPAGGTGGGSDLSASSETEAAYQIMALIRTSIQPEQWDSSGGPGRLGYWAGRLMVITTPENQEQIESLLRKLRGGE